MKKIKLYSGLIVAVFTLLYSTVYAIDAVNVVKKDSVVIIEKTITQNVSLPASDRQQASADFVKSDPKGFAMTVIAMGIVIVTFLIFYLVFRKIANLNISFARKKSLKNQGITEEAAVMNENESGEVFAAIAMALHLYQSQFHDEERTIITMEKVARTYSPWSSKIYGLRHKPNNN